MLNGSRNRGGQPDTFLMHTYKIYFRFYLLLLPLCLASIKMAESGEKNCAEARKFNPSALRHRRVTIFRTKFLVSLISAAARPCHSLHANRLTNDTESEVTMGNFATRFLRSLDGGFCVIKYILKIY